MKRLVPRQPDKQNINQIERIVERVMQTFEDRLRQRAKQEQVYFKNKKGISVLNAHDRKSVFSSQVLEEARRRFQ